MSDRAMMHFAIMATGHQGKWALLSSSKRERPSSNDQIPEAAISAKRTRAFTGSLTLTLGIARVYMRVYDLLANAHT